MLLEKRALEVEFVSRFAGGLIASLGLSEACYIFDRINNSSLNASEWVKVYDPDPLITKKNYNTRAFSLAEPGVCRFRRGQRGRR